MDKPGSEEVSTVTQLCHEISVQHPLAIDVANVGGHPDLIGGQVFDLDGAEIRYQAHGFKIIDQAPVKLKV